MAYFVRSVMEKQEVSLDESIFAEQQIYTENDNSYIEIPLARELDENEADEYAGKLANYMFEMGHTDFDIEIMGEGDVIDEETYDGEEFHEA